MPFEKSAGAIIYRIEKGEEVYLLLHYAAIDHRGSKDYWDFAKGHVEAGEKEIDTVTREVKEETGLTDLEFVPGFNAWMKYFFVFEGKKIFKIVTYLLAKTPTKKVTISGEHIGYDWLPYEEALERLTFKNAKDMLKKANNFLNNGKIKKDKSTGSVVGRA
jgi:8-oxo-dGTP pyrophosphatase MutT (NUDIX family)